MINLVYTVKANLRYGLADFQKNMKEPPLKYLKICAANK